MSYILDALKKADRERNLSKVPTLTTVHIPVYVTGRRIVIWLVAGTLACGGALAWILRPSPPAIPVSDGLPSKGAAGSPEASRADAKPSPAPGQPPRASVPPLVEPPPAVPGTGFRGEVSRQLERRPEASPRPSQVVPRQPAKIATERAERRALEPRPVEPIPAPALRQTEPPPSVEARPGRADTAVAPPAAAPPHQPTLREASAKMTLDVFVYTDVEADRMAVINGRRYVVGQFVDGLYRVDDITPEGVVLTYQGERVVLSP
jgi:general secretion pathway protein B